MFISCIAELQLTLLVPLSQIKKLVYVYLVRYAEEQQDLALLSISTFQKALKVTSMHNTHKQYHDTYQIVENLIFLLFYRIPIS